MSRHKNCSHPSHPTGTLGRMVRQDKKAVYRERICPVCGGVQGIARVPRS